MSHVDVVVPCYNYARFLPHCVSSVLAQHGVRVRVLIIDDCSTDETEEVGRDLAQQDDRVEFRRHSENQGHISTYNEGLLEWCTAEYSVLLSADDALAPGALARATELMNRHTDVGMTYGMAIIITESDMPAANIDPRLDGYEILPGPKFLQFCCARGNPVPTPTSIVRTELQRRVGAYRLDLPHSGDMEMWMRFAVHGSVGIVRAVQAYYRQHSSNMSLQYYRQSLKDHHEIMQACEEIVNRWLIHLPESRLWLDSTYKRVGERALWLASSALDSGDTDSFHTCLQFAQNVHPGLYRSRAWWQLQAKTLLGQHLWRWLRRIRDASATPPTRRGRPPNLIGSWPGCPWPVNGDASAPRNTSRVKGSLRRVFFRPNTMADEGSQR